MGKRGGSLRDFNNTINKAGPSGLVLSYLDYCSVVWSGATKRYLGKIKLAQNRAVRLALKSTRRANINDMHVNLSWLKVEERLSSSLIVFLRRVDKLNVCLNYLHTTRTPKHTPQDISPDVRTDYGRHTVLHRAMTTWNSSPHQVTDASSRITYLKNW